MPGSRSYPRRWRSHFSGHLGNSNVQSGLRSTKAELLFKCTKSRANNSKSATSSFPFSSFSPSCSLSGHFPGGGCKMGPLISKARETEDVAPSLRKKSEQNRSYVIYHKGEWEIYKTELSKNIIWPFNFICLEWVLSDTRFWNAVLSSWCWIWGSGITFRLFPKIQTKKKDMPKKENVAQEPEEEVWPAKGAILAGDKKRYALAMGVPEAFSFLLLIKSRGRFGAFLRSKFCGCRSVFKKN